MILQTRSPNHYCFKFAKNYDYISFFKKESNLREVTKYPPFAKIERTLIDSEEEVNPMWDKYEATYNETIYLYSDKDCTIPYTAPSDRRLYVEYSETTMNGTTSRIRTLNVPAGASSFYLGQTRLYEENNMGNRVDYYSDRYDIVGPGI